MENYGVKHLNELSENLLFIVLCWTHMIFFPQMVQPVYYVIFGYLVVFNDYFIKSILWPSIHYFGPN